MQSGNMTAEQMAHNNSFNPTALSLPLINIVSCDTGCVVSSGGGLIRALGVRDALYFRQLSVNYSL